MCYYNGVKVSRTEYIRLKSFEKAIADFDFLSTPLHIGFEYRNVPVIKPVKGKEDFDIVQMEWGFLPSNIETREQAAKFRLGYKDENGTCQKPITTLNAMGESLLFEYKMFREAALNHRCLFLSTGFYEFRHIYPTNKRTGEPLKTAKKFPYRIGIKEKDYFYIAGIYNTWVDQQSGEVVDTCAMVTTRANYLMQQIHNEGERMPCILPDDLAAECLFGNLSETDINRIATYQIPAEQMQVYTICKDFKTAADPTTPFKYEGLPGLKRRA